ncbi:YlmC/YmxH family sporulation protein [Zhaonella formicivorans]|jgi:YlmC/YmxH family sporulation protein|uniref:YlmC/YmxH family sporulation protein n=1 Tax=Zhaonella formicivorans TaxID=2528593 RepID=UPI0010D8415D|nr:YlmC/YmxH family sporulation protein [Zhaonella formicivorans]
MKLSELIGKDIINIADGARLGTVGDSDLVINIETGHVESIILPNNGGLFGFWRGSSQLVIPWQAVKKIGSEVIVVELEQNTVRMRHYLF